MASTSRTRNWFSGLFSRKDKAFPQPVPAAVKIIDDLRTSQLTVKEFREKQQLVSQAAQQIFERRVFDWMVSALENSHPSKIFFKIETSANDRALHQARIEGYQLCLNNLLSMRTHQKKKEEIKETWGTKLE